ncbi:MAG: DUF1553 domain-containing protein [Candidatus Hydrogenedentes bacterium]|nr:DUF1553 domain-containing protein [Candidatus Hydrogenedentota bacterium]
MHRRSSAWVSGLAAALALVVHAEEPLQYNRDIRPIISKHCFACHGPDSAARKGELRLDRPEDALAAGAIVPGDIDASEAIARIFTADQDDLMPPPEAKLELSEAQKETLKRWIAQGAQYEKHWAFIPPVRTPVPAVDAPTPADAFIRARLEKEGLSPAPEANRETLIRRVALDLTGLPPTLAEIDAYLADSSPRAYETIVDHFLNGPNYGEHMASQWLDVARYADTYGYQNDRDSTVWPWRDWVIRAFQQNLPWDEFVRWQIAGDLIPNATQDQRLATAFNRLHRQTNEGGSVLEEFRVAYVADRTETFGTAFLGLTVNCARCHEHKFDPVSQENYFQLFAFFNNIDESGMYSHFTSAIPSPSMFLYKDGEKERHEALLAAIGDQEAAVKEARDGAAERFEAWQNDPNRTVASPVPVVELPLDTVTEGKTPNVAGAGSEAKLPRNPVPVPGPEGQGLEFNGDNGVELPGGAAFDRFQPFSVSLWLRTPDHGPRYVIFHRSMAAEDAASRGYEFLLLDGKPTFSLSHFWPGNALRVEAEQPLPVNAWTHCTITYDGSSKASGVTIYVNGEPVATKTVRDGLKKTILYDAGSEVTEPPLQLAMRFRDSGFKGGRIDSFKIFNRTLTALEASALAGKTNLAAAVDELAFNEPSDGRLVDYYAAIADGPWREQLAALEQKRKEEADFISSVQEIMTMTEMAETRQAYRLERGEYNHPAEPVSPDVPHEILPLDPGLPRNRLGLAEWLNDPKHPLAARVAVNRFWQQLFGLGIVKTQEDFGSHGAMPTNQALLDHLALDFIESGWDVKALLKQMVMTAAYRQDSRADVALLERDPDNALLARGPRGRLTAEQIRDNALASSGLLVAKQGGPSVKPYQPEGLWKDGPTSSYKPDTGDGLYRRSLYTFIKRTMPPPSLLTFNATGREYCLVRRETTVTPLQALVLLNDPQYIEAARVLAADALAGGADWMATVFRRLTGRTPDGEELRILGEAFDEQRALFGDDPEGAKAYLAIGEKPLPAGADAVQLAAATALAQAIMNHEEFQVKQ